MDKSLLANAGDTGFAPGLGRSHMPRNNQACAPQILTSRAATTEAYAESLCSAIREVTTTRNLATTTKSSPHSLELKKACTKQGRPSGQK